MPDRSSYIPLDDIRVATPCRASWNQMRGDDQVRFCQTCAKHVYNLSGMSRAEAEALVAEKEGNLCARYYRRADGTVLIADCPVGLQAGRRGLLQGLAVGLAASVAFGCGLLGVSQAARLNSSSHVLDRLRTVPAFAAIIDRFAPEPVMGDVAYSGPVLPPVTSPTTMPSQGK